MSLYNKLFGMNEDTPILLGMLDVNKEYFARFRDVLLNRIEYQQEILNIIEGDEKY